MPSRNLFSKNAARALETEKDQWDNENCFLVMSATVKGYGQQVSCGWLIKPARAIYPHQENRSMRTPL